MKLVQSNVGNFTAHLHYLLQTFFVLEGGGPIPTHEREGENRFNETRIKHFHESLVNIKVSELAVKKNALLQ